MNLHCQSQKEKKLNGIRRSEGNHYKKPDKLRVNLSGLSFCPDYGFRNTLLFYHGGFNSLQYLFGIVIVNKCDNGAFFGNKLIFQDVFVRFHQ